MEHNNFTDIPLLSPITSLLGLTGSIDGETGLEIVNDYALAFFDQHLRNKPQTLLEKEHVPPQEVLIKSNADG